MVQLCMLYSDSYALMEGVRIKTFSFQLDEVYCACMVATETCKEMCVCVCVCV